MAKLETQILLVALIAAALQIQITLKIILMTKDSVLMQQRQRLPQHLKQPVASGTPSAAIRLQTAERITLRILL